MWAQVLVAPYRFELIEVPAPNERDLHDGEVVLQMQAGAVCGSDTPLFRGGVAPNTGLADEERYGPSRPGYPLHEVVGDVIVSNSDLKVGQRVVGWAKKNDGLSDQIVAEARSLIAVKNDPSPVEQVIVQPLACVLHALTRVGEIAGQRAAVIGLGPFGLLFSHALHALGAEHVVGVDRIDRSDVAAFFGVDEAKWMSSDRWAHSIPSGDRPNIIIEAVGHQSATLNHAIEAAADGACIFYFGMVDEQMLSVDMKRVQRKELSLYSGTTPFAHRHLALARAREYGEDHPELAKAYITNVFPVEDVQKAFECADRPAKGRIKVALGWHGKAHIDAPAVSAM